VTVSCEKDCASFGSAWWFRNALQYALPTLCGHHWGSAYLACPFGLRLEQPVPREEVEQEWAGVDPLPGKLQAQEITNTCEVEWLAQVELHCASHCFCHWSGYVPIPRSPGSPDAISACVRLSVSMPLRKAGIAHCTGAATGRGHSVSCVSFCAMPNSKGRPPFAKFELY